MADLCFECDRPAETNHHVVPKVRGGKRTLRLCLDCHGLIHGHSMGSAQLTKEGLAKAKARGVLLGSARPGHWDGIEHLRDWKNAAKASAKARTQRAIEIYAPLVPKIRELQAEGKTCEQVADWLTEHGHTTSTGFPFNAAGISRILQRADGVEPKKWIKLPEYVLAKMYGLREAKVTYQKIADWLNQDGWKTAPGGSWNANSVYRKLHPRVTR